MQHGMTMYKPSHQQAYSLNARYTDPSAQQLHAAWNDHVQTKPSTSLQPERQVHWPQRSATACNMEWPCTNQAINKPTAWTPGTLTPALSNCILCVQHTWTWRWGPARSGQAPQHSLAACEQLRYTARALCWSDEWPCTNQAINCLNARYTQREMTVVVGLWCGLRHFVGEVQDEALGHRHSATAQGWRAGGNDNVSEGLKPSTRLQPEETRYTDPSAQQGESRQC